MLKRKVVFTNQFKRDLKRMTLLIYKLSDDGTLLLILTRTGTHSELF